MEPVSAAGIAMGAVSLAFQVFAGCVKGFVLLSTAHNFGKHGSTLLCMLNLQEFRFMDWAQKAGLLSEHRQLDKRLNEPMVRAVLNELHDLLLDTEKLKSRYKLDLVPPPADMAQEDNILEAPPLKGALGNTISDQLRYNIMYDAKLIKSKTKLPRRLWWAAVDKQRFSALIDTVRGFITELWNLQDLIRQDDMSRDVGLMLSHVIRLNNRVDQIMPLQEALQRSSTTAVSSEVFEGDSGFASAAELRLLNLRMSEEPDMSKIAVSQEEGEDSIDSKPDLNLDLESLLHFEPLKGNFDMGVAQYQKRPVFVEWKGLPSHSQGKIMARVHDLVILLHSPKHSEFRSLECIGLGLDSDAARVAFVYQFPLGQTFHSGLEPLQQFANPPESLRSLFRTNPSITDRVRLALQVTQSLKWFHTSGWLHKNLRSENILFPTSDGFQSLKTDQLEHPILIGFAFSRQDSPSQISEQPSSDPERDIYRHPEAMGEPSESFTALKDIYSLGIILLEIGEWRSLKSLVKKVVDVEKSKSLVDLAKVRPFLLDDTPQGGLNMLRFRMGDTYTVVTRMMLTGQIPESLMTEKNDLITFQPDILDIATRELSKCTI